MRLLILAVATLLLVNGCATKTKPVRTEPHQRLDKNLGEQNSDPVFSTAVNASQAGGVEEEE